MASNGPCQLFVLVSTGQAVANLPPVLEWANREDKVLWIESPEAAGGKWSSGATGVLRKFDLDVIESPLPVPDLNDPPKVAEACAVAAAAWKNKGTRVVLVANGGVKLAPVGLVEGWAATNPVILYGTDRPAALRIWENGLNSPFRVQHYQRHRLDLEDILAVKSHCVAPGADRPPVRLWSARPPESAPLPPLGPSGYGSDQAVTGTWHGDYHRWFEAKNAADDPFPSFAKIKARVEDNDFIRESLVQWRRSLFPAFKGGVEWARNNPRVRLRSGPAGVEECLEDSLSPHDLAMIYNATRNFGKGMATALARHGLVERTPRLGDVFENLVARRTVAWLQANAGAGVVQSAWMSVPVCATGSPATRAQLDVALVLRNGILLHIECKTFLVDQKDLDARLFNLQQVSSQLAEMTVCGPLFTPFSDQPWFEKVHALRVRLEDLRRPAFTPIGLPGQPTTYRVPGDDRDWACPDFESGLDRLLKPYLLSQTAKQMTAER